MISWKKSHMTKCFLGQSCFLSIPNEFACPERIWAYKMGSLQPTWFKRFKTLCWDYWLCHRASNYLLNTWIWWQVCWSSDWTKIFSLSLRACASQAQLILINLLVHRNTSKEFISMLQVHPSSRCTRSWASLGFSVARRQRLMVGWRRCTTAWPAACS